MLDKDIVPIDTEKKKQLATYDSYKHLKEVARDLFKSGLFTHLKNETQAITVIEYGRELGIPPVQALQTMAVVNNKLCMEAKLMLALAQSNGYSIDIKENNKEKCILDIIKPNGKKHEVQFTMQEAEALGLAKKDNWQKQPTNMLFWRAVAKGIRRFASDSLLGIYTIDELTEGEATTIEEIQEAEFEEIPESPLPEDANQYLTVKEIKAYEENDIKALNSWKFELDPIEEIEHRKHLIVNFDKQSPAVLSIIRMVREFDNLYDWEKFKKDVLITQVWKELNDDNKVKTIKSWMKNIKNK